MITDNFFDLQRFVDGVIDNDGEKFTVVSGDLTRFAGTAENPNPVGSAGNAAHLTNELDPTAVDNVPGTSLYLNGTTAGYSFAVDNDAAHWNVFIQGAENVVGTQINTAAPLESPYFLTGTATLNILSGVGDGEGFDENVNGANLTIKTNGDAPATVSALTDSAVNIALANPGAATVDAANNSSVVLNIPTAGVQLNGTTVKGIEEELGTVAGVILDSTGEAYGIRAIDLPENKPINISKAAGPISFTGVNLLAPDYTYVLSTSANQVTLTENAFNSVSVLVKNGESYTLSGMPGVFTFEEAVKASGGSASASIDGAAVSFTNNQGAANNIGIYTDADASKGVVVIDNVNFNDVVNVTDDSDGYSVQFNPAPTAAGDVLLRANAATVFIPSNKVDLEKVTVDVNSAGTDVTIKGIEGRNSTPQLSL